MSVYVTFPIKSVRLFKSRLLRFYIDKLEPLNKCLVRGTQLVLELKLSLGCHSMLFEVVDTVQLPTENGPGLYSTPSG